jgi:hypothetical protein
MSPVLAAALTQSKPLYDCHPEQRSRSRPSGADKRSLHFLLTRSTSDCFEKTLLDCHQNGFSQRVAAAILERIP